MKNRADYSQYECPYAHIEKDCGHELKGPDGYENTYGVWCECGFRGPVFYLEPDELGLKPKAHNVELSGAASSRATRTPGYAPTLLHGDCLDLMALIPDGSVDMILCDLPYGTTACKWDTVIPFDALWAHYKRVIKPNGAVVLFGSQPFTSALVMSNPKSYKHSWIWNKRFAGNFVTAKYAPMKIHEDVCVFGFETVKYNPQMILRDVPITNGANKCASDSAKFSANSRQDGFKKVYTHKFPESILLHPRERGLHPTQKPVALCEYLIRTYTNEGETVLDSTMGSGTVGIACLNTGRNFIGIEKDPKYFEIARNRIMGHNVELSGSPSSELSTKE